MPRRATPAHRARHRAATIGVELYEEVLHAVILALSERCALEVLYDDAEGIRARAMLQPHALVQRGPILYPFALKNDETAPMRLYALHRMLRAEALRDRPARLDFDLDRAIAEGKADFGQGDWIDLELRARGYLATILSVCTLSDDQQIEDEPDGSPFELRHTLSVQAAKIAALYQDG